MKAHIEKEKDGKYYEVSTDHSRHLIGEYIKDGRFVFTESYNKLSDEHKKILERWIGQVKKIKSES